jgi:peptide-methionine (R)-S-oxide reductase
MGFGRLILFLAGGTLIVAVAYATSPSPAPSYAKVFAPGFYLCSSCGAPLFESEDKFDSGTRWPSFRRAREASVATRLDTSHGLRRTEILCAACGLHLGHRFADGRELGDTHPNAGARYCVLSASLRFVPDPASASE